MVLSSERIVVVDRSKLSQQIRLVSRTACLTLFGILVVFIVYEDVTGILVWATYLEDIIGYILLFAFIGLLGRWIAPENG